MLNPNGLQVGGPQGKIRVLFLEKRKRSLRQQNSNWTEEAGRRGREEAMGAATAVGGGSADPRPPSACRAEIYACLQAERAVVGRSD